MPKKFQAISAVPFCDIAPRGHRSFIGKAKRVIFTSCSVDPATRTTLVAWATTLDLSRGQLLDHLAHFAEAHEFMKTASAGHRADGMATTPLPPALPSPLPQPAARPLPVKRKAKPILISSHA